MINFRDGIKCGGRDGGGGQRRLLHGVDGARGDRAG